jgi:TolA-binding protein
VRGPHDFGPWLRALLARQDTDAADIAPAAGCPDPFRIWEAVDGGLPEDEVGALLEHSLQCPACAAAWRLARELASQVAQPAWKSPTVARAHNLGARRSRPAWVWAAALAATAILVVGSSVLWLEHRQGVRPMGPMQAAARWADLEVPVLEVQGATGGMVFRDGAGGGELTAAIESYLVGDFAAAAEDLGRWAEEHPEDVQARLLLGVALLKTGEVDGAVVQLEGVASLGATDVVADARFYLALAYLKRGEEGKARAMLLMVEDAGGRWKAEAGSLLLRLAEEGGGAR